MGDKSQGLMKNPPKFRVERTDGLSAEGQKHYGCEYFVLDLTHDPHALPAILAYAFSCEEGGYEKLATDLVRVATDILAGSEPDLQRADLICDKPAEEA